MRNKELEGEGSCSSGRAGKGEFSLVQREVCGRTNLYPYSYASLHSLLLGPSAHDSGPEKDAKNFGHKLFPILK